MPTITQNLLSKTKKTRSRKAKRLALLNSPQRAGVCRKVTIRTPKKPCSGRRAVAFVDLSSGYYIMAKIPGDKNIFRNNLTKFSRVLVRVGRVLTVPECKYKLVFSHGRNYCSMTIPHVMRRSRSLWGQKNHWRKKRVRIKRTSSVFPSY